MGARDHPHEEKMIGQLKWTFKMYVFQDATRNQEAKCPFRVKSPEFETQGLRS